MRKLLVALFAGALFAALVGTAIAAPPGAVRGSFSKGWLASSDEMSRYISGSDVWCAWRGDHVVAHVTLRNRSVERVEATIKPRYYLRNGGEHGSSFFGAQDFKINARSTRSLLIDAGTPDDVSGRPAIRKCAPYLYLLD
jgi:hypothetical protein